MYLLLQQRVPPHQLLWAPSQALVWANLADILLPMLVNLRTLFYFGLKCQRLFCQSINLVQFYLLVRWKPFSYLLFSGLTFLSLHHFGRRLISSSLPLDLSYFEIYIDQSDILCWHRSNHHVHWLFNLQFEKLKTFFQLIYKYIRIVLIIYNTEDCTNL